MAFAGCIKLKDVVFNHGLEQIKVEAFSRCSSLEEVNLPATVGVVGKKAFAKCDQLVTVSLSEGLVRIDDGAFANSNKLDVIKIPISVESVGKNIVPKSTKQEMAQKTTTPENAEILEKEIEAATEIVDAASAITETTNNTSQKQVKGKSKTWASMSSFVSSALSPSWNTKRQPQDEKKTNAESPISKSNATVQSSMDNDESDTVFVYLGGNQKVPKDVIRVRIDPTVKKIEPSAFARCKGLTDVEFSENLVEIGFSAFYYCSSVTLVRLPSRTEVIGNMAFLGCSNLVEVSVPSTVAYVGKSAF
ncbi:unnamed protein product, partial [Cylindrotheca closterium]